jgi:hypothetical protein
MGQRHKLLILNGGGGRGVGLENGKCLISCFSFFHVNGKINANVSSRTDGGYSVVGRYICLVVAVEAISSVLKCMQMMANGRAAKLL